MTIQSWRSVVKRRKVWCWTNLVVFWWMPWSRQKLTEPKQQVLLIVSSDVRGRLEKKARNSLKIEGAKLRSVFLVLCGCYIIYFWGVFFSIRERLMAGEPRGSCNVLPHAAITLGLVAWPLNWWDHRTLSNIHWLVFSIATIRVPSTKWTFFVTIPMTWYLLYNISSPMLSYLQRVEMDNDNGTRSNHNMIHIWWAQELTLASLKFDVAPQMYHLFYLVVLGIPPILLPWLTLWMPSVPPPFPCIQSKRSEFLAGSPTLSWRWPRWSCWFT